MQVPLEVGGAGQLAAHLVGDLGAGALHLGHINLGADLPPLALGGGPAGAGGVEGGGAALLLCAPLGAGVVAPAVVVRVASVIRQKVLDNCQC